MKPPRVTVERFYTEHGNELKLSLIAGAEGLKNPILEPALNRPGLAVAGFVRYFAHRRVQIFGNAETAYLRSLAPARRAESYAQLFSRRIPCIVFCRDRKPNAAVVSLAEKHSIPVFKTPFVTMAFINRATALLEWMFAPLLNLIGSMADILGVGVIIIGESGIGKSECVLALIERGYSLVADDTVMIRLIDNNVEGSGKVIGRNYMEVRGIGVIDVAAMFGVRCIRNRKNIDLIIRLYPWEKGQDTDRLGLEEQHEDILGVKIPSISLQVRPGRDMARLVEVAAFQTKLKAFGYNPASELNQRIIAHMNRA